MSSAGPIVLKGWTGNRADSPVEVEVTAELAREFMQSSYYDPDGSIWRSMPLWLASADGRNIAWEPGDQANRAALDALYWHVRMIERKEHRR